MIKLYAFTLEYEMYNFNISFSSDRFSSNDAFFGLVEPNWSFICFTNFLILSSVAMHNKLSKNPKS